MSCVWWEWRCEEAGCGGGARVEVIKGRVSDLPGNGQVAVRDVRGCGEGSGGRVGLEKAEEVGVLSWVSKGGWRKSCESGT